VRISFVCGVLDVGVVEHSAPEGGDLMRVVDLDDVELLDQFGIDLKLLSLESWNDPLAQINSH
jgi:hypothetical protein